MRRIATLLMLSVVLIVLVSLEADAAKKPKPKTLIHPFVDNSTLCDKAKAKMDLFLQCALAGLNSGSTCSYTLKVKDYPDGKSYDDDPASAQNQALMYHKWTAVSTTGITYACGTINYQYRSFSGDPNCGIVTLKNTVRYKFDFDTPCIRTDVPGCTGLAYGCAKDLKIAPPDNAAGCTFDGFQLNCKVGIDTHIWPLQCKDDTLKPIDSLALSQEGLDTLKGIEKFSPMAYYDTVCAITIGYGFTQAVVDDGYLASINYDDVMTETTASDVLKDVVSGRGDLVKTAYAGLCMPQEVFDALVIVAYNCEVCLRSSYRILIQNANWADLATQISKDKSMDVSPQTRTRAATLISTKTYDIQSPNVAKYWRCQIYHTGSCTPRCAACRNKNKPINGEYPICDPNDQYVAPTPP